MLVFKKCLQLELSILIRKYYIIVFFLISSVYLRYGYNIMTKESLYGINFLETTSFVMIGLNFFSIIIGVISSKHENRVDFEELSNTLPAFWRRYLSKFISWNIVCFIYVLFLSSFIVILNYIDENGLYLYYKEVFIFMIINFYIPMLSFWLLGYSIEKLFNKVIGWPLLLLIWYITLSYSVLSYEQLNIALNQYFEFNTSNSSMQHYGLDINPGILIRKVWFLLFCLSLYILIPLIKRKEFLKKNFKSKLLLIFELVFIILSIYLFKYSTTYHSQYMKWEKSNLELLSTIKENFSEETNSYINGKIDKISILLNKSTDNSIDYDIIIKLKNTKKGKIEFTLYKDLNISNFKLNGLNYNYKRNSNYISLDNTTENDVEISFNVSGDLPLIMGEITSRTLLLTSDTAWYPILGHYNVVKRVTNEGYTNNNLISNYKYEIEIKSNRGSFISDLSNGKGYEYQGYDYGPNIIQGKYEIEKINNFNIMIPTQLYHYYYDSFSNFSSELKDKISNIKESSGVIKNIYFVNLPNSNTYNVNTIFKIINDSCYLNYSLFTNPSNYENPKESMLDILSTPHTELGIINSILYENNRHKSYYFRDAYVSWLYIASKTGDIIDFNECLSFELNKISKFNLNLEEEDAADLKNLQNILSENSEDKRKELAKKLLNDWTHSE
ncbi:MAG: hypothetical protein ABF289_13605 [Clostridiales bacterium]